MSNEPICCYCNEVITEDDEARSDNSGEFNWHFGCGE